MTRDQIVERILQRMGNNQDPNLSALVVAELKAQQTELELEPELPWFLWKPNIFTQEVGEIKLEILDVLQVDPRNPFVVGAGSSPILYESQIMSEGDIMPLLASFGGSTTTNPDSLPTHYALEAFIEGPSYGYRYRLFPLPTYEVSVWAFGYYADDALNSGSDENRWSTYAPSLLMGLTGKIIAGQYSSLDKFSAMFAKQEEEARMKLRARTAEWEERSINRVRGGRDGT